MPQDILTLKDVLPLIFERFSASQMLWSLYITVTLGIAGFIAVAPKASKSITVKMVLTISFVAFAYVNLSALLDVRFQREKLADIAIAMPAAQKSADLTDIITEGEPDSEYIVGGFHLSIDAILLLVIWVVPLLKAKDQE